MTDPAVGSSTNSTGSEPAVIGPPKSQDNGALSPPLSPHPQQLAPTYAFSPPRSATQSGAISSGPTTPLSPSYDYQLAQQPRGVTPTAPSSTSPFPSPGRPQAAKQYQPHSPVDLPMRPSTLARQGPPSMPMMDGTEGGAGAGAGALGGPGLGSGVMLGLEALERQQAELEQRRAAAEQAQLAAAALAHAAFQEQASASVATSSAQQSDTTNTQRSLHISEDDQDSNTAPSSTMNSSSVVGSGADHQIRPLPPKDSSLMRSTSFGKFFRTPLKHTAKLRYSRSSELNPADDQNDSNDPTASNKLHYRMATDTVLEGNRGPLTAPSNIDKFEDGDDLWHGEVKPLVYGFLNKLGRNGVWQRRFFETDGECLTYYKSNKRTKVLATLDLCKVGEIAVNEDDITGRVFTIQVLDRPYYLRAENKAICKDWVISLNRVKEARMEVGGFKLVPPEFEHSDSMHEKNRTGSGEYAPRVVLVATRPRTRHMSESSWLDVPNESLSRIDNNMAQDIHAPVLSPMGSTTSDPKGVPGTARSNAENDQFMRSPRIIAHLRPGMTAAKWHKRRTNFHKMSLRLARWARSMKTLRCMGHHDDVLQHHENVVRMSQNAPGVHHEVN
eukprot:scaffold19970_cov55-Attheya_sp.AAC.1